MYYTAAYPAYQIPTMADLEDKAGHERYKLEIVKNVFPQGRLLEIGPSYGGFAYLAKNAGFEVETIERDSRCCQFLTEVLGVRTVNSADVLSALRDLRPYHVIALWQVIEHLENPWSLLMNISQKILPGGILILTTPNPVSLQFKVFGRYWTHVDAPRHLQLIPPRLLADLLESWGMEVVSITTRDEASSIFHTVGWWAVSFRNLSRALSPTSESLSILNSRSTSPFERKRHGRFHLGPLKTFLRRSLGLPYSLFLKPIEQIEGLGSAYTAIFRKKD
jgi:hypothetical protein